MPRLPSVGGDDGNWGTILNSYLAQEHNTDGSHKKHAVTDTGGQVYNVKAFGAMGNGTTDDTTSIINTLTACASGGVVYLPPGTYLISNTINITNNNVTLMGAGAGATTIKAAAGSEGLAMIIVGNGTDTLAHTTIAKILFTSQNQKTANQAIKLQKAFKTWIYNVRIEKQYNGNIFQRLGHKRHNERRYRMGKRTAVRIRFLH